MSYNQQYGYNQGGQTPQTGYQQTGYQQGGYHAPPPGTPQQGYQPPPGGYRPQPPQQQQQGYPPPQNYGKFGRVNLKKKKKKDS